MLRTVFILFLSLNLIFSGEKVLASDASSGDTFGRAVSNYGDWFAVGANRDDDNGENSGSVYLYKMDDYGNYQEYKLMPTDGDYNDYFGKSLSIYGDWLAVSSIYDNENGQKSGSVYLFYFDGSNWNEFEKIYPTDGEAFDRFGYSLDLYNNKIVIGSIYDDDHGENSGSAYVYIFNGSSWVLEQKINSDFQIEEAHFGRSVAIYDDMIVVGAYAEDNIFESMGSVTIFKHIDQAWQEIDKIFSYDGNAYDFFGNDVDIYEDILVVGSYYADNDYDNSGSVYVYKFYEDAFLNILKINAYDEFLNDNFGISVSVFNNFISVGTMNDDNGTNSGAVYIYEIIEDEVNYELKIYPEDGEQYDEFGSSVSLFDNYLIAGSRLDDDMGYDSGSVYIFNYRGCADANACNYESTLIPDNQFCIYPDNSFDCDGNCIGVVDECGVCDGTGASGDIDFNGVINVNDIILLIDYMVENEPLNMCTADINNDNLVNITDLVVIIDIILNF